MKMITSDFKGQLESEILRCRELQERLKAGELQFNMLLCTSMIEAAIQNALKAIKEKNLVAMVRLYHELKSYR